MNCHLCGEPLTWDNVNLWKVNGRTLNEYGCRNKNCKVPPSINTDSPVFMQVIMPDEQIDYYLVRFSINDKWYQAAASEMNGVGGTTFSVHKRGGGYRPIIEIPRFITMQWREPLDAQVEVLKNKLRTLLPFL